VVGDVGCVRSVRGHRPGRIGFLLVESLLIPAEGDCRLRQLAEECDVIGYVHQVRGGVGSVAVTVPAELSSMESGSVANVRFEATGYPG